MRHGVLVGLLAAKATAVAIAVLAVYYQRKRAVRLANIGYGVVVVWNLLAMIGAKVA